MRQNLQPNPSLRLFEVYNDFSGGVNSETSNEKLKDNEYPILDNVDLSSRGSAKRRYGRTSVLTSYPQGMGQGVFFYFRNGNQNPDVIMAVGGQLYTVNWDQTSGSYPQTYTQLSITGLSSGFQATRPVEAVQYKNVLYIATGTQLVQYDGTTASVVTPYTPTSQEAIYVGLNGLASNPSGYIQDGTGTKIAVAGISPQTRSGAVGQGVTFTAFLNKPASVTSVKYQWQYKKSTDTAWTTGQAYAVDSAGKSWTFTPDTATNYDIQVQVQDNTSGTADTNTYLGSVTGFPVAQQQAKPDLPYAGIQTCNKILLYFDRILLYGDTTNPYQLYVSDLQNPAYFPTGNTLSFDIGKQEPLTTIVHYRNMLIAFTPTSIQPVTGTNPGNFNRVIAHDSIGCVAGRSAQVVGNNVVFLSYEGIQQITPNLFISEMVQIERIDYQTIKSAVPVDTNACAIVHDNMYWICFPGQSIVYRFYYYQGIWARDASSKLNLSQFAQNGNDVYNLTQDGKLWKHATSVYNDCGEVYTMVVESKFFDFDASYNFKRLKRFWILGKNYPDHGVDLDITVYGDAATLMTPDTSYTTVDASGSVQWVSQQTPNFHFYGGTILGQWVMGNYPLGYNQITADMVQIRGKCRRIKVHVEHSQDNMCEIFGFAFQWKIKKPW